MTLGHNNKGMGASWYVERALLEDVATGAQRRRRAGHALIMPHGTAGRPEGAGMKV